MLGLYSFIGVSASAIITIMEKVEKPIRKKKTARVIVLSKGSLFQRDNPVKRIIKKRIEMLIHFGLRQISFIVPGIINQSIISKTTQAIKIVEIIPAKFPCLL